MGNSSSTHEPLEKGFTRGTFGDANNAKAASFRQSKRSPRKMDRLRRSFRDSFRRRKERVPESSKPHQWQSDESAVRSATCSFAVKYLGCVEVFESRGMQVCEEALKVLRNSRRRPVRGLLHVSGDGLRVVDDDTKGLIVDQTIEKVSFCAPDRNHERGFSYICRDGTTRRWMCHGFLAAKDSGERLSHAVGCAFAVCLERKQRRDKECGVTMTFDMKNSTFTRTGSFRQHTMTERLAHNERSVDAHPMSGPPSASVAPQQQKPFNPFAIERPHATPSMLERQGSFRGFSALGSSSPFKRQMSLRINDLPSNAERQRAFLEPGINGHRTVSPIPELSPAIDSVSALCQELSQELSLLTKTSDDMGFPSPTTSLPDTKRSPALSLSAGPNSAQSTPDECTSMKVFSVDSVSTGLTFYTNVMPRGHALSPTTDIRYAAMTNSGFNGAPSQPSTAPVSPRIAQRVVSIDTAHILPNADQWLGDVVKSTSPSPRRAVAKPPQSPPSSPQQQQQQPATNHVRAKSLNSGDPFDAEWAAGVAARIAEPPLHSTNPFISPPKAPAQSFQVQL